MGQTAKAIRKTARSPLISKMNRYTISCLAIARRSSSSSSPLSSRSAFSSPTRRAAAGWRPDAPLPLRPGSPRRAHYLAPPVFHLQGGVHGLATLRFTLSQMRPEVARDALIATHGGLSLEWSATICHISPMALYRLICALGQHSLVTVLVKCRLPLPAYILADEKHSRCLTDRVYLPTIVSGRVIWHLGYSDFKSAAAFTESYGEFQHIAFQQEPSYQVKGALTDGFDSTVSSMRTLFPGARLGFCLRHALNKLPDKLVGIRPRCAEGCAPSSTPCCTGVDSAKVCGSWPWVSVCATLPIALTRRWEKHTVSAFATGSRPKKQAGTRCSKTPRCRR